MTPPLPTCVRFTCTAPSAACLRSSPFTRRFDVAHQHQYQHQHQHQHRFDTLFAARVHALQFIAGTGHTPPPLPSEFLVTGEGGGAGEGAGEGDQVCVDVEGDDAAAASHSHMHADHTDENCGELWAIIAHVWRLGCVLLTHAGRCVLHRQLQTVRLVQATAVADANHAASASLEGSAVGSAAAASAADGADTRAPHFAFFGDASTLDSFAAKGMRLPPLTPVVHECISDCFQLFNTRIHTELMKNVCACVRALTRYLCAAPRSLDFAPHDDDVFALLHVANFLDAPLLLRR